MNNYLSLQENLFLQCNVVTDANHMFCGFPFESVVHVKQIDALVGANVYQSPGIVSCLLPISPCEHFNGKVRSENAVWNVVLSFEL